MGKKKNNINIVSNSGGSKPPVNPAVSDISFSNDINTGFFTPVVDGYTKEDMCQYIENWMNWHYGSDPDMVSSVDIRTLSFKDFKSRLLGCAKNNLDVVEVFDKYNFHDEASARNFYEKQKQNI